MGDTYNIEILYKPVKANLYADALSGLTLKYQQVGVITRAQEEISRETGAYSERVISSLY